MKFCSNCGRTVSRKTPQGDSRRRWVCGSCGEIHYQNPKIVVGCVPEKDGRILLCKRAIEPRSGYWTVPAGFMELGETMAEGAIRETREEACAEVGLGHLFAAVDVIDAGQVHVFFTATLFGGFAAGDETEDVALFRKDEIPWPEIAFLSGRFALQKFLEDAGGNNGVHLERVSRGE